MKISIDFGGFNSICVGALGHLDYFYALKTPRMKEVQHKCIKNVGEANYIKYGKAKNGKQRFKCKACGKSFLEEYTYNACRMDMDNWITSLVKESATQIELLIHKLPILCNFPYMGQLCLTHS